MRGQQRTLTLLTRRLFALQSLLERIQRLLCDLELLVEVGLFDGQAVARITRLRAQVSERLLAFRQIFGDGVEPVDRGVVAGVGLLQQLLAPNAVEGMVEREHTQVDAPPLVGNHRPIPGHDLERCGRLAVGLDLALRVRDLHLERLELVDRVHVPSRGRIGRGLGRRDGVAEVVDLSRARRGGDTEHEAQHDTRHHNAGRHPTHDCCHAHHINHSGRLWPHPTARHAAHEAYGEPPRLEPPTMTDDAAPTPVSPSARPEPPRPGRMAGELALVTGATSGIGRAIAIEFAAEGARVVIHGRDQTRGQEVVDAATAAGSGTGGTAVFVAAELSGETACEQLIADTASALGGLTVLVNNAVGVSAGRDSTVGEMSTAYWEDALRVNLTAPMILCRAALPHMLDAGHGAIINVSSRQAERPSAGLAAYAASKGGLNALTRVLAMEYASHNIRANTLSPGFIVNTRRDADMTPERRARVAGMHLTRLGEARDAAYAAVYLASSESEFLTGINLQLDGGSSIGRAATLG